MSTDIGKLTGGMSYDYPLIDEAHPVDRKDVNGKVDPFHMPWEAIIAYNAISDYGNKKYGNRDTWKHSKPAEGVRRYLSAMVRHAWKVVAGEYIDSESGLPHVYAVVWNAGAACWHYAKLMEEKGAVQVSRKG